MFDSISSVGGPLAAGAGSAVSSSFDSPGVIVADAVPGGAVALPAGFAIADAEFARSGGDLVLTAPDGSRAVVRDFFAADPPPALTLPEGVSYPGALAAKLAGPAAPAQVAQAGVAATAEPIGQVEAVEGTVTVTRADGTVTELGEGDPVFAGDVLASGPDGAIGIVFADGTSFSMAENGRMVLDEMIYDPGADDGRLALSVVKGVFTFVSGEIARTDPEAMTIGTPVATIGIRGTQGGIDIADGQTLTVVLMPEANGYLGEIIVLTEAGARTLNLAEFAVTVTDITGMPSDPFQLTVGDVIQVFQRALGILPDSIGSVNDYGVGDDLAGLEEFETAAGEEEVPEGPPPLVVQYTDVDYTVGADQIVIQQLLQLALDVAEDGDGNGGGVGDDDDIFPIPDLLTGQLIVGTDGDDTLVGGPGGDTIQGLGGNDLLLGNDGDDILDGGSGDDQVFGGAGNDLIVGGTGEGEDLLDGGTGRDTVVYTSTSLGVEVDLEAGIAAGGEIDGPGGIGDTLAGIENVVGGGGNDELIGDGENNLLVGSGGDDVLVGLDGNDELHGDFAGAPGDGTASVVKVGGNHDLATAQNLDPHFGLVADPNVFDSDIIPHVSVTATGDGGFDFYRFAVPMAGAEGSFDIDFGQNIDGSIDTELVLYDAFGNVLAENDDSALDPGSVHSYDSEIHYTFAAAGVYYIVVGEFPTSEFDGVAPPEGDVPDVGDTYTLHVSIEGHPGLLAGDDLLIGGEGDDLLFGEAGDDLLLGGPGSNRLDGGAGIDTVEFAGNFGDYAVDHLATGVLAADGVAGRDGTNQIVNVEYLQFADLTDMGTDSTQVGTWTVDSSIRNHFTLKVVDDPLLGGDLNVVGDGFLDNHGTLSVARDMTVEDNATASNTGTDTLIIDGDLTISSAGGAAAGEPDYSSVTERLIVEPELQEGARFTHPVPGSLAVDDGRLLAGSSLHEEGGLVFHGTAHIFAFDGGGWSLEQELAHVAHPADPDDGRRHRFGQGTDIDGDIAVVGERDWGVNWDSPFVPGVGADGFDLTSRQGIAHVYTYDDGSGTWSHADFLNLWPDAGYTPAVFDSYFEDLFGYDVAVDADAGAAGAGRIIAGAVGAGPGAWSGQAYVFENDGTGNWDLVGSLTNPDPDFNDYLGAAVDIDGDVAVSGTLSPNTEEGQAYVYEDTGGGWARVADLHALIPGGERFNDNMFGLSVAVEGNTIVVGARDDTSATPGKAYVFQDTGSGWELVDTLAASDGANGDAFGTDVAIDGGRIVVTALNHDVGATANAGKAYVYEYDSGSGSWVETDQIVHSAASTSDRFGSAVDLDGEHLAVGAELDDTTFTNQGAVLAYEAALSGGGGGAAVFINSGAMTVGGDVTIESSGTLTNEGSGTIDIGDDLTVTDFAHLQNDGSVSVSENMDVSGEATVENTSDLTLTVGNDLDLSEEAVFTNTGTLIVEDDIEFEDEAVLENSGTVSVAETVYVEEQAHLQNDGTMTVGDNMEVLDEATVENTSDLTLTITGDLDVSDEAAFTNTGTLAVGDDFDTENEATFENTGTLTVTDNTDVEADATWTNQGTGTVTGGSMRIYGDSTAINAGMLALSGAGGLHVAEGGDLTNSGTLTSDYWFAINDEVIDSFVVGSDLAMVENADTGTVTTQGIGVRGFAKLVNDGTITIEDRGTSDHFDLNISNEATGGAAEVINSGVLNVGQDIRMDTFGDAGGSTFTNTGAVSVGVILDIGSTAFSEVTTFDNQGSGTVSTGILQTRGVAEVTSSGTVEVGDDLNVKNDSSVFNAGDLTILGDDINVENDATFGNTGTTTIADGLFVRQDAHVDNFGAGTLNTFSVQLRDSATMLNAGMMTVAGIMRVQDDATVNNDGTLDVDTDLHIEGGATLTNTSDTSLLVANELDVFGTGMLINTGTTVMENAFDADVDVNLFEVYESGSVINEGTFILDASFSIDGDASFTNAGTFDISGAFGMLGDNLSFTVVLDGEEGGETSVDGSATFDGVLTIQLADGFTPSVGETFDLFTYDSFSGGFDAITGTDLGAGLTLDVTFGATAATATVLGPAAPGTIDLGALDGSDGFALPGIDAGDFAGTAVSAAGDVNGDGFGDFLVGATGADGPTESNPFAGEAYIVFGQGAGWSGSFDPDSLDGTNGATVFGVNNVDSLGVATAGGDINGDGISDIVVGVPNEDESYVIFGQETWPASVSPTTLDGSNGFRIFIDNGDYTDVAGRALSMGDVNGDGFDDVILGA